MDIQKLSPMMRHYMELKKEYPDCIMMYRLGDFYEMFFDDAIEASRILDITLTGRDCGMDERAPMCGVPYHALDAYVAKLLAANRRVAICEQLTKPTKGVMVDRGVIRVITPGTVIEDSALSYDRNNYLVAVYLKDRICGITWCDISTGEAYVAEVFGENEAELYKNAEEYLLSLSPSEIIAHEDMAKYVKQSAVFSNQRLPKPYYLEGWRCSYSNCYASITKQFSVASLIAYGIEEKKEATVSSGMLFQYLNDTQKRSLSQITKLSYKNNTQYMVMDFNSKRNLEIFETLHDHNKKGSLLWVLDKTETALGARKIRRWLEEPLRDEKMINLRLDAVENLLGSYFKVSAIKETLKGICDIERLCGKLAYGSIKPRELLALADALTYIPTIKEGLSEFTAVLLKRLDKNIDSHKTVASHILKGIDRDCATSLKEGGVIKLGFSKELDELKDIAQNGMKWLAALEQTEREETGIKTLKVKYNRVFGYYIEVTKSFLDSVPLRYIRKQTTANSERYTTPELKKLEEQLLTAMDKSVELENELYNSIVATVSEQISKLLNTAQAIAELDALVSFAVVSESYGYVKPTINAKSKEINIKNGKHPVLLALLGNDFVANDTLLDGGSNRTMIITGPNMAGKSTYMRQVALITLMAHIGCYVPATEATITICDRIFTRVGASDDLSYGLSTFMVEMLEVATIMNFATANSLILLDEVGRGTSTYDGLSIAWAVMEHINSQLRGKTLFATHYHELTTLEGVLEGVKNYRVLVNEINEKVVFLHRIVRGGANKSFGIEVASIAGVPSSVTDRARDIIKMLEASSSNRDANAVMLHATNQKPKQMNFLEENEVGREIVSILKDTDINSCTPLQCFGILKDLIEKARKQ